MYVTTWTFSNSTQYQIGRDCLYDADLIVNLAYQQIYNTLKSACDENDILNTVLEIVKLDNGTCTVDEHFFSSTLEKTHNFQQKFEFLVQLFQDNGWPTSVRTQENVEFDNFQSECEADPLVVRSNFYELVDVNPYIMWQIEYPTTNQNPLDNK